MAPPDPSRAAETKAWLDKAALDLRGLEIDRKADPPFLEDALFHSQQLAEKSLKAFPCWHDTPFRKTHNLVELGEACARLDPSLKPLLRKAAVLTEYAWKFRYPGDAEEVDPKEAEESFRLAKNVFKEIKERLALETYRDSAGGGDIPEAHEAPGTYAARPKNKGKAKGKKRKQ